MGGSRTRLGLMAVAMTLAAAAVAAAASARIGSFGMDEADWWSDVDHVVSSESMRPGAAAAR